MVDLGTLGGTSAVAIAVNDERPGRRLQRHCGRRALHAFSWTQAGGMVDLGTLGGTDSYAHRGQRRAARSSA